MLAALKATEEYAEIIRAHIARHHLRLDEPRGDGGVAAPPQEASRRRIYAAQGLSYWAEAGNDDGIARTAGMDHAPRDRRN